MPEKPADGLPTNWPLMVLGMTSGLQGFQPPAGAFDPQGAWEHSYHVCMIANNKNRWACSRKGGLRLRREPDGQENARLSVSFGVNQVLKMMDRVEARLRCRTDALASLLSWEARSLPLSTPDYSPMAPGVKESGTVSQGALRRRTVRERVMPVAGPVAADWGLFDAVQRLPFGGSPELHFTLLEDLALLRPEQRLGYKGARMLPIGGQRVRVHLFGQFGRGILPHAYGLDEQHRLLFVINGFRAYFWASEASLPEVTL